jgi:hypothetical protein
MSFWIFSNRLRPARRMLSGSRHGSLLQLSARRKRNDARRPGRSGRARGNHGNAAHRSPSGFLISPSLVGTVASRQNCFGDDGILRGAGQMPLRPCGVTPAWPQVLLRKARPATRFRPRKRAAKEGSLCRTIRNFCSILWTLERIRRARIAARS